MKNNDLCFSYSFSFQLKTCQDIRYYRKTSPQHDLKNKVETFILNFILKPANVTDDIPLTTKGRPKKNKTINEINKYESFQFPLKKSTIQRMRDYKKNGNTPNLDKNVEEYIKLVVPCRDVR